VAGAGLGLAIPINATTRRIISALLSDGRVRRAYLGLVSTPMRLNPSAVIRTGQREGLRIVEVLPGSPADKAGLTAGDILLTAGGRPVSDAESLQRLLFSDAIGEPLDIAVLRDGVELHLVAVPEEMSSNGN
jgi:serine protease Do